MTTDIQSLFNIQGKKVIVTGGANGLGNGIATGFHEAGAEVVLIDISEDVIEIAQQLSTKEAPVHGIQVDVTNKKQVEQAFNKALKLLNGRLDVIVNNAGVLNGTPTAEISLEEWDQVFDVNVHSVFHLCKLAGEVMVKQQYGKIINLSSIRAFRGGYGASAYSATKGAISQLTKSLSNEWASKGINVNALAPGYIDTKLSSHILQDPIRNEQIVSSIPAKRWGTPDDLKGIAIFLASDASQYINGAIIPIDGGFLNH